MQQLLERFIISSTPAWRVLLAVFFSLPFFVMLFVAYAVALTNQEIRAGTDARVLALAEFMQALGILTDVGVALWLWPRRDLPEPVPRATLLVCLMIGLNYTVISIACGTFTTGTTVVLGGVLTVGLLLFERGPMLLSYIVCMSTMALHDLGVVLGWWPYAPALNAAAFEGLAPTWWFALWREYVFVAGYTVLIGLVLLLFERLDAIHAKLTRLSYTDGLTGLSNRRRFMEVFQTELARQARTAQPLCLVLIDADHFKQVNDRYGHAAGDDVLRVMGRLLMACVRTPTDLACRLGGEEFALILPDTRCDQAEAVCARMRAQLAQQVFGEERGQFGVTVSMGVVQCAGTDVERNLRLADQQLYRAKAGGRNQICRADQLLEAPT